ncbi:hypothetical protein KJ966_20805 [bacterium]|nr:hypothetical protein [bacterium]
MEGKLSPYLYEEYGVFLLKKTNQPGKSLKILEKGQSLFPARVGILVALEFAYMQTGQRRKLLTLSGQLDVLSQQDPQVSLQKARWEVDYGKLLFTCIIKR